jgi:hypothetical protein
MRFASLAAGATLVLALVGTPGRTQEPAQKLTDAEITKLLVGKWYEERKEEGREIKATNTFRQDGTFSAEINVKLPDQTFKVSVTGTWKVMNGVLIETIETSDPPVIKKGQVSKDQVLSFTDKEYRYKSEFGGEHIKKRVAD